MLDYRFWIHYGIHFLLPLGVALYFFKDSWKKAFLIMLCGLLIDLDHLWATPIYEASRCSINFHLLHSWFAIVVYALLAVIKPTRIIGIGLLIHILADSVDCLLMQL